MTRQWNKLQKEYNSWIHNPLAMAKCDLFVKTKNHSVKIKPKYQTGLYTTLVKQIIAEPGKTYMLIKATLQFSEAEKVALLNAQWDKYNKATLNKYAKCLSPNLIADRWNASAEELVDLWPGVLWTSCYTVLLRRWIFID